MKQFAIGFIVLFTFISLLIGLMAWRGVIDNELMHQRLIQEQANAQISYRNKMNQYMNMCVDAKGPLHECALAFGCGGH